MASIRKRTWKSGGETKTAWIIDYRDSAGARRGKTFERKKDAEAWLTNAAWEVSKGVHTADSQSVTVAEAAEMWIKVAETNDRERGTVQQYRQLADLHIKPFLGAEKLSRLTQPRIEIYRDQLLESRSKDLTSKTIRALSRILREAMRRGLVAQNVALDVKVVRSSRERTKVAIPTTAELRSLLQTADADFKPLMMTAMMTGLRASELRGLPWTDVDFKAATITVSQRADKYCHIGPPKSAAGYRTIPIAPELVTLLKEWKLRCPIGDLGLVFPNRAGNVQDYGHLLRRKFFPLQIKAGICDPVMDAGKPKLDEKDRPVMEARYGLHALRHAAASAWIKQKIDIKRLQVWIGHENIELTIDTYGHLIEDTASDAALIAAAQADLLA